MFEACRIIGSPALPLMGKQVFSDSSTILEAYLKKVEEFSLGKQDRKLDLMLNEVYPIFRDYAVCQMMLRVAVHSIWLDMGIEKKKG